MSTTEDAMTINVTSSDFFFFFYFYRKTKNGFLQCCPQQEINAITSL